MSNCNGDCLEVIESQSSFWTYGWEILCEVITAWMVTVNQSYMYVCCWCNSNPRGSYVASLTKDLISGCSKSFYVFFLWWGQSNKTKIYLCQRRLGSLASCETTILLTELSGCLGVVRLVKSPASVPWAGKRYIRMRVGDLQCCEPRICTCISIINRAPDKMRISVFHSNLNVKNSIIFGNVRIMSAKHFPDTQLCPVSKRICFVYILMECGLLPIFP